MERDRRRLDRLEGRAQSWQFRSSSPDGILLIRPEAVLRGGFCASAAVVEGSGLRSPVSRASHFSGQAQVREY